MKKKYRYRAGRGGACTIATFVLGSVAGVCAAGGATHDIKLPTETAVLTASPLPGYQIATQKCGICHSADYISLQPPQMSLTQWTAEMGKMQRAYGAPIDDAEIKLLGIYLASAYGDATTVTPAETALTLPGSTAAADSSGAYPESAAAIRTVADASIDVHAVLDHNACLSCHARQQKVVGPAYRDVAIKYAGDSQARSKIQANIRAGGAGKWGTVPMPPFPSLSTPELQSLADFVLDQ